MTQFQPYPYQAQRPPEQMTRVYKNSKDFLKDEKKFRKQGWMVANTTANQIPRSLGGKLFVPFGFLTKKSEIIVTYQRGASTR